MGWVGEIGGYRRGRCTRSRPDRRDPFPSTSARIGEFLLRGGPGVAAERNETLLSPPPPTDAKAEDLWDGKSKYSQRWDMPNRPKDIHWKHEE